MKVFLSHQKRDRDEAAKIAAFLRKCGIDMYFDEFDRELQAALAADNPKAVVILNQRIRPFTAKWHRLSVAGELESPDRKKEFRDDLESLQEVLRGYTGLLATVANVEDITALTDG